MKKTSSLFLLLSAAVSALFILPATAQSNELNFPQIQLTGTGSVQAEPDMAKLAISVTLSKDTAQGAKNASDQAVANLLTQLTALGIAKENINTANLSLQPEYAYPQNEQRKLTGYQASREVNVTVFDLSKVNVILDTALNEGLNQVNNITLLSTKENELKQQALQLAIADAKEKAQRIANGFGEYVIEAWQINYVNNQPQPFPRLMLQAENSPEISQTYQNQQLHITDSIDVTFKLTPKLPILALTASTPTTAPMNEGNN